ncbi:unnamed protein product [Heligmosomoides polygyrus]|uniref:Uncharacterized protein n=1 Tax=Heligmosomoides polygyrus TaxID=6339 RepID=A0A3P8FGT9_HELPZ|nr:unnamed protein product [Heligmosomoides polygyrus]
MVAWIQKEVRHRLSPRHNFHLEEYFQAENNLVGGIIFSLMFVKLKNDLCQHAILEVENITLSAVCNADQSGFTKEMHSARSLPSLVSATTHSFTVMPLLYAECRLENKLFVEPRRTFPAKGIFEAPNLVVRANTAHIMTKQLMLDWLRLCAFPETRQQVLLLVDS